MDFVAYFEGRDLTLEFYQNLQRRGVLQYRVEYDLKRNGQTVTIAHYLKPQDAVDEVPAGQTIVHRLFTDRLLFGENLSASGNVFATREVAIRIYTQLADTSWTEEGKGLLKGTATNPPPLKCDVFLSSALDGANIYITPAPGSVDVQGYLVWVSDSPTFDAGSTTLYDVTSTPFPAPFDDYAEKHIKAAAYDSFGKQNLNPSDTQSTIKKAIVSDVDMEAINARLNEYTDEITQAIDAQNADLLAAAANATNNALAGVKANVTAVANDLSAEVTNRTLALAQFGQNVAVDLSELEIRVDDSEAFIEQVEDRITATEGNLSNITLKVTQNTNKIGSEATRLEGLITTSESGTRSLITTEETARTTADTALGTRITNLTSVVSGNTSAIQQEAETRATELSSLASVVTSVQTTANQAVSYRQNAAPTGTIKTGALWTDTDDNNRLYRWSGSAWQEVTDPRTAQNTTNISSEITARTNADTALGGRIDTLTSTVSGNLATLTQADTTNTNATSAVANRATTLEAKMNGTTSSPLLAKINDEITARADGDSAQAGRSATIEARLNTGDIKVSITNAQTVAVDAQGKVNAQWSLISNANGLISGIKSENNGTISRLDLMASRIRLLNDSGAGALSPFTVEGGVVKMQKVSLSGPDVSLNINNRFIVNAAGDCSWYSPTGVLLMKAGTL